MFFIELFDARILTHEEIKALLEIHKGITVSCSRTIEDLIVLEYNVGVPYSLNNNTGPIKLYHTRLLDHTPDIANDWVALHRERVFPEFRLDGAIFIFKTWLKDARLSYKT